MMRLLMSLPFFECGSADNDAAMVVVVVVVEISCFGVGWWGALPHAFVWRGYQLMKRQHEEQPSQWTLGRPTTTMKMRSQKEQTIFCCSLTTDLPRSNFELVASRLHSMWWYSQRLSVVPAQIPNLGPNLECKKTS